MTEIMRDKTLAKATRHIRSVRVNSAISILSDDLLST
jgi:hypothetical protein